MKKLPKDTKNIHMSGLKHTNIKKWLASKSDQIQIKEGLENLNKFEIEK